METRQAQHFEEYYPEPLNQWLECHCYPSEEGLTVYFHDVTERKRVEEELQRAQEEYRLLVESQTDMVSRMSRDGRRLYVNANYLKLVGKTEAEVLKTDFFPEIHPDDALRVAREWQKTFEPPSYRSEIVVRTRNAKGEWRWCSWRNVAVLNGNGEPSTAVCVGRDVTELKEAEDALRHSEERLRLFVEHAPVSLAMFDREMRYIGASRRWMMEYLPGYDNVTGKSHYEVLADCPERWRADHQRGLAGEVVSVAEDSWTMADGSTLWMRYEVRPWFQGNGEIGGIMIHTGHNRTQKVGAGTGGAGAVAGFIQ